AVVLAAEAVRVVRGGDGEREVVGQAEAPLVQRLLAGGVVSLDLEVVAAIEDDSVPGRDLPGRVPPADGQVPGHFSRHAGGADDQAAGVLRENLTVDPGAVVEALAVPDGGEPDEVAVALLVTGEEDEVVVGV